MQTKFITIQTTSPNTVYDVTNSGLVHADFSAKIVLANPSNPPSPLLSWNNHGCHFEAVVSNYDLNVVTKIVESTQIRVPLFPRASPQYPRGVGSMIRVFSWVKRYSKSDEIAIISQKECPAIDQNRNRAIPWCTAIPKRVF